MLLGFSLNAHQLRIVLVLFVYISTAFETIPAHAGLSSFQITQIDTNCTSYATFQSQGNNLIYGYAYSTTEITSDTIDTVVVENTVTINLE